MLKIFVKLEFDERNYRVDLSLETKIRYRDNSLS